jgi:hypothetical protein
VLSNLPTIDELDAAQRPIRAFDSGLADITRDDRIRKLAKLKVQRRYEGLSLYRPLPLGEEFHSANIPFRVAGGGNRSSKTISCSVEAARAFCGCDPHDKYRKENGHAWVVGLEADQLTILYRKMFEPGAFRIIKDEFTGCWRSVRPDPNDPKVLDPYDLAYAEKWKDAPPLIPERMVRSIAWEDRAKDQPRLISFTNGWRSLWRSSKGDPPQGDEVHLVLFDEEMLNLHFFYEAVRGMTYLGGNPRYIPKMIWSATAQVGNIEFSSLCDRAEQGDKSVRLYDFLIDDNPYVSSDEKEKFLSSLPPGERETRYYGIRADKRRRCYPMYDPMTNWENGGHGTEPIEIDPVRFCRWVFIDPGISPAEVLFVAIDPEQSRKLIYDGFQMDGATGDKLAQAIKDRERGMQFEGFIIDSHMGRQSPMTDDKTTVAAEYRKAFENANLFPRQEGAMHGFFPGCGDLEARTRAFWRMLEPRRDGPYAGTAELCVVRGMVPELDTQIRSAQTDPKNSKKRLKLTGSNRPTHLLRGARGCGLLDCFDQETEALTSNGWKLFKDTTLETEFATVDISTDTIVYHKPHVVIDRPYCGDMIRFGGQKLDALVTPGHRMLSYRMTKDRETRQYVPRRDGPPQFVEASDLSMRYDQLKLSANWTASDDGPILVDAMTLNGGERHCLQKEIDPGLFAEFLGWYVAEGSVDTKPKCPGSGYRICVSQVTPYKKAILKALLEQLPWNWIEGSNGFTASSKQLWTYLMPLGNKYQKYVPNWIKLASKETIRRFLIGAVLGDGTVPRSGGRQYYTTSRRLADDMQELFLKCGTSASILNKKQAGFGGDGPHATLYTVVERLLPFAGIADYSGKWKNEPLFKPEHYEGRVYCATVPTGTLIVRRNGKPLITGNCGEYMAVYNPTYFPPTEVNDPKEKTAWDYFQERQRINRQAEKARHRMQRMRTY